MALNVENLRKQAKTLIRQLKSGDESVAARVQKGLPRLSSAPQDAVAAGGVTLQEAQHVIAVEQGYASWKDMLAAPGARPRRARSTLFLRPGLANVRREAQWCVGMVHRGEGWILDRMRRGLPHLADMTDAEITRAGVTLEEARQAVALDYGFPDWPTLEAELGGLHPVRTFEDFAEIEDHELRQVIFRLGRDRLAVALKGASERLLDRVRTCMEASAWQALADAMEAQGPLPASVVEAEQARILTKFRSDDPLL